VLKAICDCPCAVELRPLSLEPRLLVRVGHDCVAKYKRDGISRNSRGCSEPAKCSYAAVSPSCEGVITPRKLGYYCLLTPHSLFKIKCPNIVESLPFCRSIISYFITVCCQASIYYELIIDNRRAMRCPCNGVVSCLWIDLPALWWIWSQTVELVRVKIVKPNITEWFVHLNPGISGVSVGIGFVSDVEATEKNKCTVGNRFVSIGVGWMPMSALNLTTRQMIWRCGRLRRRNCG